MIKNKSSGPNGFIEVLGNSQRRFNAQSFLILPKIWRGSNASELFLQCQHTLIPKTGKDYIFKKLQANISDKVDVKILNRMLANKIQQNSKRIIYHNLVGFFPGMQGWFNISKSINGTHHINKLKDKNNDFLNKSGENI